VTVSQLPGQAAAQDVSDVLKSAHTGYLGSVGALPENSTTTRGTLGDGTAILFFDVKLKVRDELMVSHGFWAYSRARIIRVAVTYSTSLSPAHTAVARYFPQTFGLVTR